MRALLLLICVHLCSSVVPLLLFCHSVLGARISGRYALAMPNFRRLTIRLTICLAGLLSVAPAARAWSNKEHTQFARLAAEHLVADPQTPPAMREWLKQ